jgi:hypothetical protein
LLARACIRSAILAHANAGVVARGVHLIVPPTPYRRLNDEEA